MSSTAEQRQVGQTMVQFAQVKQRSAMESHRTTGTVVRNLSEEFSPGIASSMDDKRMLSAVRQLGEG